jgi:prepilin-type N-terminal cleavage/methylation domain-containing protein
LSYHKLKNQKGFTIIEIIVVLVVVGIVGLAAFGFFNNAFSEYLSLQQDSVRFGDLAMQSQRITNVLRGLMDITQADNDELTIYAYFAPNDTYTSLVRYYKNTAKTELLADVTPMTANPPDGTPITASKKTYTIIGDFYETPSVKTFEYLDSAGDTIALPITDLHTVKGVKINLAVPTKSPLVNGSSIISSQVALRNRKTNL